MKIPDNKEFAKLTKEECRFIEFYRKLSEEKKREILQIINDKSSKSESD